MAQQFKMGMPSAMSFALSVVFFASFPFPCINGGLSANSAVDGYMYNTL